MKVEDYNKFDAPAQNEYLATLGEAEQADFLATVERDKQYQEWIAGINEEAAQKAAELSIGLNAIVEPAVYVIEPFKDAAVAYIKKPDAMQAFKIINMLFESNEYGYEMAARAQLIRTAKGVDGANVIVSDPRFMDANGKYEPKDSMLNLSLLLKMRTVIDLFKNEFKKK